MEMISAEAERILISKLYEDQSVKIRLDEADKCYYCDSG